MKDLIERQAAIDEIARWIGYLDDDMIGRIQLGMRCLPSAQPDVPDTNVGDLISRQAAIDILDDFADNVPEVEWRKRTADHRARS